MSRDPAALTMRAFSYFHRSTPTALHTHIRRTRKRTRQSSLDNLSLATLALRLMTHLDSTPSRVADKARPGTESRAHSRVPGQEYRLWALPCLTAP